MFEDISMMERLQLTKGNKNDSTSIPDLVVNCVKDLTFSPRNSQLCILGILCKIGSKLWPGGIRRS